MFLSMADEAPLAGSLDPRGFFFALSLLKSGSWVRGLSSTLSQLKLLLFISFLQALMWTTSNRNRKRHNAWSNRSNFRVLSLYLQYKFSNSCCSIISVMSLFDNMLSCLLSIRGFELWTRLKFGRDIYLVLKLLYPPPITLESAPILPPFWSLFQGYWPHMELHWFLCQGLSPGSRASKEIPQCPC